MENEHKTPNFALRVSAPPRVAPVHGIGYAFLGCLPPSRSGLSPLLSLSLRGRFSLFASRYSLSLLAISLHAINARNMHSALPSGLDNLGIVLA